MYVVLPTECYVVPAAIATSPSMAPLSSLYAKETEWWSLEMDRSPWDLLVVLSYQRTDSCMVDMCMYYLNASVLVCMAVGVM